MELKIWCKTFLNAYRCLEKITQAIDKIVLATGLNLSLDASISTSKILELTERKITLINLKLFIEKLLNSLEKEHAQIIVLKYVDQVKSEDIANQMNMSCRTFFRKVNASLKSLELALKRECKTHEILLKEYEHEAWLIDLFEKLKNQELLCCNSVHEKNKNEELFQDSKMVNFAYQNYKKMGRVRAII